MIHIREANFDDFEAEWQLVRVIPTDENGYINPWYCVSRADFDTALYEMIEAADGIGLPEGYVPETTLFIWNDMELIGQAKVRHYLTDTLAHGSGHIGYWIAPQYRGRGIGTEALRLILQFAEDIVTEKEFYLRADKTNPASIRIMEKNGGHIVGEDGGKVFVRIARPDWSILDDKGGIRTVCFSDMDAAADISFMDSIEKHYALMLTENGEASAEGSLDRAKAVLKGLREDKTAGNTLKVIADAASGETVGYIWYKYVTEPERSFAYTVYLYINEESRNKGYGTAALKKLEADAQDRGFNDLRLCVMRSNEAAERLYGRLGYKVYAEQGPKRYMIKR